MLKYSVFFIIINRHECKYAYEIRYMVLSKGQKEAPYIIIIHFQLIFKYTEIQAE